MNRKFVFLLSLIFSMQAIPTMTYAHGGGLDEKGCHAKNGVRHCHGDKAGLYLPEREETRIKKLHKATCDQKTPEGYYPKRDLYGKRCNAR